MINTASIYVCICKISNLIQSYAIAANSMGEKAWVKAGNVWIESMALQHCLGEQKCSNDTGVVEANNITRKIRLLDVGSCYNPFESCSNAAAFSVTALDLCPAKDSVFICDFLKVSIGEYGSEMIALPIRQKEGDEVLCSSKSRRIDIEGHKDSRPVDADQKVEAVKNSQQEIVSLPAGSFDVVAISLVLSYLPDPAQRCEMLRKARALLRPGGM